MHLSAKIQCKLEPCQAFKHLQTSCQTKPVCKPQLRQLNMLNSSCLQISQLVLGSVSCVWQRRTCSCELMWLCMQSWQRSEAKRIHCDWVRLMEMLKFTAKKAEPLSCAVFLSSSSRASWLCGWNCSVSSHISHWSDCFLSIRMAYWTHTTFWSFLQFLSPSPPRNNMLEIHCGSPRPTTQWIETNIFCGKHRSMRSTKKSWPNFSSKGKKTSNVRKTPLVI